MAGLVFTGASGVGKSTLAAWAAQRLKWPLLPSVTGDVYREFGTTHADAMGDQNRIRTIQRMIHDRTATRLMEYAEAGRNFVTDRGADCLAYTALMCRMGITNGEGELPDGITGVLNRRDVAVVFVRPARTLIESARRTDLGRRNIFLSDEWVYRIDGAIRFHLEACDVPYLEIDTEETHARIKTVEDAISTLKVE